LTTRRSLWKSSLAGVLLEVAIMASILLTLQPLINEIRGMTEKFGYVNILMQYLVYIKTFLEIAILVIFIRSCIDACRTNIMDDLISYCVEEIALDGEQGQYSLPVIA